MALLDPDLMASANWRAHRERHAYRVPFRGSTEEFVGRPHFLEVFLIDADDKVYVFDERSRAPRCCAGGSNENSGLNRAGAPSPR